jgi:hypothetical protein
VEVIAHQVTGNDEGGTAKDPRGGPTTPSRRGLVMRDKERIIASGGE